MSHATYKRVTSRRDQSRVMSSHDITRSSSQDAMIPSTSPPSLSFSLVPLPAFRLKMIGLFCKRTLSKREYSAKETYNLKEPTHRSHPIARYFSAFPLLLARSPARLPLLLSCPFLHKTHTLPPCTKIVCSQSATSLQHTVLHYYTPLNTATHCNTLQLTSLHEDLVPEECNKDAEDLCLMLQCVAVCCSVLQCVAVCCSVLQCVATVRVLHFWKPRTFVSCFSVLQCVAVCGARCCSVLQCLLTSLHEYFVLIESHKGAEGLWCKLLHDQ